MAAAPAAVGASNHNDMQRHLCIAVIRRVLSSGLSQQLSSPTLLAHASKKTYTHRVECTRQTGGRSKKHLRHKWFAGISRACCKLCPLRCAVRRSEAPTTGRHSSAARRERCCSDVAGQNIEYCCDLEASGVSLFSADRVS